MSSLYDLVGPVLPQALRLARYQASANPPQSVNDLQSENDAMNQTPSREEERLLVSNANVMTALEDLFSWIEKDRTSRTSRLSRMESFRFQRAIYRIWLMSVHFKPHPLTLKPGGSAGEHARDRNSELRKSWDDQKSFLQQFSTQELFQIDRLTGFLSWIAQWAVTAERNGLKGPMELNQYNDIEMLVFAGPHAVLRGYEDATIVHLPSEHIDAGPYTQFIEQALSEIAQERQVTVPLGYGFVGFILDNIHDEHDKCRHCDGTANPHISRRRLLPNLYNETNWEHLKGRLNRHGVVPGNLCFNLVEEEPLVQAFSDDWSQLLREMFTCRQDEYAQWSKQDWICGQCWATFFKDTIWRWRLWQKKKAGERIEKDCRYGYKCWEQCQESGLDHAGQFNHLCQPIEQPPFRPPPRAGVDRV
ncbi:hypothetical protein L210DRAFT_3550868 [Boletus edulis BED1]|uniref:Uncharacterized protein n=1 Tax=Boletus edulis BED1 TaxID=1328754 RepID=A0AAD4GCH4_BOLED|nr:hypothetical protein L210DRAFT_3550868 [Boletus edulis BED1]